MAAGGVLSGEHGIGLEKRDFMPLLFGPADLDAQARLREAFDPDGLANPDKVLPAGSRCGDLQQVPGGRVDLSAVRRRGRRRRPGHRASVAATTGRRRTAGCRRAGGAGAGAASSGSRPRR